MKNLFKKYFNSVLQPDEFSKFSEFLGNRKNESVISDLMKSYWSKEISAIDVIPKDNPALFKKIQKTIAVEKEKATQRTIRMYSWGLRVAAVLLVTLLLSNIFFLQNSEPGYVTNQLQTIITPLGAKSKITLPDGSIVWLNSGSTLTYSVKFGKSRPVKLVGEAYFKVVKNDKPFVVSTNYGDVKVLGTSFNVMAYDDDNAFETTLEEGSVAFKVKDAENGVTLKPGEQIVKINDGFTVKKVEPKYFTSWKEGTLLFNREPFPSFIKKLERWYNVKIEYNDQELDELWYTGTIEMESISEVMEMISKAAPVNYSFNSKTRVFTIKAN